MTGMIVSLTVSCVLAVASPGEGEGGVEEVVGGGPHPQGPLPQAPQPPRAPALAPLPLLPLEHTVLHIQHRTHVLRGEGRDRRDVTA